MIYLTVVTARSTLPPRVTPSPSSKLRLSKSAQTRSRWVSFLYEEAAILLTLPPGVGQWASDRGCGRHCHCDTGRDGFRVEQWIILRRYPPGGQRGFCLDRGSCGPDVCVIDLLDCAPRTRNSICSKPLLIDWETKLVAHSDAMLSVDLFYDTSMR